MEKKNIVNLTPHTLNEVCTGTVIPPSGMFCRVGTEARQADTINNIPVFEIKPTGTVTGLPEPEEDTVYIVSAMAYNFIKDRDDILTVGNLHKDKRGNILGCNGFRR